MPSSDKLVRKLNALGYVPVFLPRTGLVPPDVYTLTDGGHLERHGPLQKYLTDKTVNYTVQTDGSIDLGAVETSDKNISGSASFLANVLKCIGISSAPKLELGFAGSSALTFSFEEVTVESIDPADIETSLASLDFSALAPEDTVKGRLHVAYEYLCAKSLLMYRSDRANFKQDVTGVKVADYIDVGAKGVVEVGSSSIIKFKTAGDPVRFAYKAGTLEKRASKWRFRVSQGIADFISTDSTRVGEVRPYLPARGVVLTGV